MLAVAMPLLNCAHEIQRRESCSEKTGMLGERCERSGCLKTWFGHLLRCSCGLAPVC